MNNILFLSKVSKKYLDEIKSDVSEFEIVYAGSEAEALKYIDDTEIIVSFDADFIANLIGNAPKLKWIHLLSAGADTLPFDMLLEKNILLTNSKDVHKYQISQQVVGYMLIFERSLNVFIKNQMKKIWDRSVRVSELTGKTACIVGVGSIGDFIAGILREFGMKVLGVRNSGRPSENVDEMYTTDRICDAFSASDYVISTLPLTDDTFHLIGEKEFNSMRSSSYFINIGRGKVVDEKALISALKNGVIKGAALDVFEQEPLPEDSPLWEMDNVIITPHIAGITPMYMERAIKILKYNLNSYINGLKLKNIVDLTKQY